MLPQNFSPTKYFVNSDLEAVFHAQFTVKIVMYLHTKFHIPKFKNEVLNIMFAFFHFP